MPPEGLDVHGDPEGLLEVGTLLTLTCRVERFRPKLQEMYWTLDGQDIPASPNVQLNRDGTFSQEATIIFR